MKVKKKNLHISIILPFLEYIQLRYFLVWNLILVDQNFVLQFLHFREYIHILNKGKRKCKKKSGIILLFFRVQLRFFNLKFNTCRLEFCSTIFYIVTDWRLIFKVKFNDRQGATRFSVGWVEVRFHRWSHDSALMQSIVNNTCYIWCNSKVNDIPNIYQYSPNITL